MVKVLHLVTSLGGGGAERQLLYLCQDPDPAVSYKVVSLMEGGDLLPAFQETGKYLGHLGMTPGRPSIKSFQRLCSLLKSQQPDVLQTWLYHADLLGFLAGKKMNVPKLYWNIRCSNMDLRRYGLSTKITVGLNAFFSKFPEALLFNSFAGKKAHQEFGFKPKEWIYMPNGFSLPEQGEEREKQKREMRGRLSLPEDALVLGMVARVDPMKDHMTFLQASAALQKQFPHLHVVLVGKGTSVFQGYFGKSSFGGDLSRLHCLEFQRDASSLIYAFDGLVLASRFGEGFPNVLGEAMARSVPVFSSDVGDAKEIIGKKGHIFPIGDSQLLAGMLSSFLSLPEAKRFGLGSEFYTKIKKSYSLGAMRERYKNLYTMSD